MQNSWRLRSGCGGAAGSLETGRFEKGLYGVSEMFVEPFLKLIDAGIIKREVDGALLHAAFFLGPKGFYRALREMPAAQLNRIQMKAVSFTNEVLEETDAKRRARIDARFVNNVMMATLLGAAVSDGLDDGRIVSGVGGQYNFVAQAFALQGARSILTLEASRGAGAKAESNIRWSYGHQTIPRHLRDVFVTEYGVADVRGKSDADVIAAMLAIADSRFQGELIREAKEAGKLAKDYEIPAAHRENYPERIVDALKPFRDVRPAAVIPVRLGFHRRGADADPGVAEFARGVGIAAGDCKTGGEGGFSEAARQTRPYSPGSVSTNRKAYRIGFIGCW